MNYEIILATSNKHKLQEVRQILSQYKIVVYGLSDLNLDVEEVEENGKTYEENALIKAKAVQKATSMPIISDDSGLEIFALNNEPGLYSNRYSIECGSHQKAIAELLKRLDGKKDTSAQFVCCVCLLNVEAKPLFFVGKAQGKIVEPSTYEGGFGYDPCFWSDELHKTFAQASQEEKNAYSHRAKALKKLVTYLLLNNKIEKKNAD